MIRTYHETVVVKHGGIIEIRRPDLPVGASAEVSIEIDQPDQSSRPTTPAPHLASQTSSTTPATEPIAVRPRHLHSSIPTVNPEEFLFPELVPTTTSDDDSDADRHGISRQQLLAALAASDLGRIELKVAYILQHWLDTRDDDVALLIRYFDTFQADVLERWDRHTLDVLYELDNVETIIRSRRRLQNQLQLFVGTLRTRLRRHDISQKFYKYFAEKKAEDPEIRFYLDETKGEAASRYAGIAGICVIDWRQYEMYYAALCQWRLATGWTQTLHVSSQAHEDIDKHLALLGQLQARRAGLLFVGHDIMSRRTTHRTIIDLFIQLVIGSLKYLKNDNCLQVPHAVVVVKESDDGFDRLHLSALNEQLQQQIAYEFPQSAYLRNVVSVPKGREVLLEAADMIAAGIQRRALYGGWNPKDKLADAVANVTGFEDSTAKGVVYKAWYRDM